MTIKSKKPANPKLQLRPSWRNAWTEPSTWAGIATVIGAVATEGLAGLATPQAVAQLVAGVSLIALREVREEK